MTVTLYHNPACSTSRTVLNMIREAGTEPEIILYLKTPPTREQLNTMLATSNQPARTFVRPKGELYTSLNLADKSLSDESLLDAIAQHPELLNRPVVTTPLGTRVCRPKELLFEVLSNAEK
ncbi:MULTISPECIES: arsenate reductase (glutaredoxin) [Acetobacter]|uniref:Arsenate reductase n=1 Tax=Acetobacter thailandicus TaxID=1502842 RepID=A0ABT3QDM7_9PROT|nr:MULTISPECIES: arsenate reductase (glutaredoxin) [Acetobacter]MBS0960201.1 arsenate reductase (glutaredoxin) [Acetobacter thailandicus]MBS0979770.1 arsenate reductase (glutaredoxin) [Acetobacter thailandicus]MBS0985426.1 arsenate reductase (glutaredoxin) [Acetobacter thailandicus]MCX2563408.1 arsenate reductase (glutaredoxin) [Acetobacter thailandicus]NHN94162.1 arsenate reductase (glutaredoxin) [Acetobacter thailandicus]